jgi:hypothetical protein
MISEEIVAAYIRDHRADAREELVYYRKAPSLRIAISRASEKRSSHQNRIRPPLLKEAEHRLQASADIGATPDFEKLHSAVERLIGPISGIGELCVYDIAHRIAAFCGFEPKLVYLHRGTREGARALGFKGKTLDPALLPAAFSRLTPAEIEDCLCIYKAALASGKLALGAQPYASLCRPTHVRRKRSCRQMRVPGC